MNDRQAPGEHPADQLLALTLRTLTVLYVAFWVAVVVYAAIAVVFLDRGLGGAAEGFGLATAPDALQIAFLAAGALCLFLALRLGAILLRADRIWQGEQTLAGLSARLGRRRAVRGEVGGPGHGERAGVRPGGEDPVASDEQRHAALTGAVQHVLGRAIVAHLIPWVVAEVPAVLGLVDRFLNGVRGVWPILLALSAAALILRRPSREGLREILDPVYRTPLRRGDVDGIAPRTGGA